jgi:hypothetical protein
MIYCVLMNADFTEGRGPMLLHKVFDTRDAAHRYIMSQAGIFGSEQKYDKKYDSYNGYDIKELPVYTEADKPEEMAREERRQKALAKLSQSDREALGLK